MPAPAAQPHIVLLAAPNGHPPAVIAQRPATLRTLLADASTRAVARPPVPYSSQWSASTKPARARVVENHLISWLALMVNGTPVTTPLSACDALMFEKSKSESMPITM